jgi:hypothetical protein
MANKAIMDEKDGETVALNPKQQAAQEEARARRIGQAVQCMKRFFDGKPYYKPYPDPKDDTKMLNVIPPEVLICPTNINIVIDTLEFNDAMEIAGEEIAKLRSTNTPLALAGLLDNKKETAMYMKIVREFRRLEIPYDFQGGMLLLYLWLCEGVEFK